ncbi:signal recognition particle, SRP9/SRP14 subunit [Auriscalpium vulgare]|uniref:Signal recognition particle, SRP9/SRP14 subunit n=1 Tax=Auriscalpium vulgare TaxID=40419 RepID=A0ACB8S2B7_9AGAM|nr:signal recognition particle, SRP9/SRP14 subunit [Auriscalpium vulgare]
MVYINSWQDYQEAAEALYSKSPDKTRYCVKWKSSEGKLVLKITDDTTCLKFQTHSSIFLNRFEALNRSLMQKMTNTRPAALTIPTTSRAATASPAPPAASSVKLEHPATPPLTTVPAAGGPVGGGVKKKKGKKK